MSDMDILGLLATARAATHGAWSFEAAGDRVCGDECCYYYWSNRIWVNDFILLESHHMTDEDAQYIATFDPIMVSDLLEEIVRLRLIVGESI